MCLLDVKLREISYFNYPLFCLKLAKKLNKIISIFRQYKKRLLKDTFEKILTNYIKR